LGEAALPCKTKAAFIASREPISRAERRVEKSDWPPGLFPSISRIPSIGGSLLAKIPRLEEVSRIILYKDGTLILSAGNHITPALMQRLRNFAELSGIQEPIQVQA
jgi:hypothetical protein